MGAEELDTIIPEESKMTQKVAKRKLQKAIDVAEGAFWDAIVIAVEAHQKAVDTEKAGKPTAGEIMRLIIESILIKQFECKRLLNEDSQEE